MEKLNLTWDEVDEAVYKLAMEIRSSTFNKNENESVCIVPIVRGGLPIGTMLSHRLGINVVKPVAFQTRDGRECEVGRLKEILREWDKVIFAEDILDSGETFKAICEVVREGKREGQELVFTSLCKTTKFKDTSKDLFDYKFNIYHVANNVDWVVFPWEVESIVETKKKGKDK